MAASLIVSYLPLDAALGCLFLPSFRNGPASFFDACTAEELPELPTNGARSYRGSGTPAGGGSGPALQDRGEVQLVSETQVFDITIIGGGPTGLFGAFYAGMRQMSTKIVDGLEELGGQLTALYPEKYIYDMPGFPRVKAKDLVKEQAEQGLQYGAELALGEKIVTIERREDGVWVLTGEKGTVHLTRTVVITGGAGSFSPKRLPLEGVEQWEGRGLHYFVKDPEVFRDRNVLIVGGGDSALDYCLQLEPVARQITLIHRRDKFRAHEETVEQLLRSSVEVNLFWETAHIAGDDAIAGVRIVNNKNQEERDLEIHQIITALGFHADIGPIKTWGLELDGGQIKVNSRMETNLPGVYGAGDIVTYDGKLKLIATGVGEAAIAVNHAKTHIDPSSRAFPGHSSELK
jgi:ferredoxin/flavodoxin---NADP+ reductase